MQDEDGPFSGFKRAHPFWGVFGGILLIVGIVLLINGGTEPGLLVMLLGASWAVFGAVGLNTRRRERQAGR
jgi:uncharacterized membrane protein HdeD (DUF308 family)